jgi:LuxR family maltose regulon positive regulatory protein
MPAPLLQTKFYAPRARPEMVPRPRLLERLKSGLESDNGFARKLTVVLGPAGYGKTTLVSLWLDQLDHPHTWLSLDDGDNDPARFLAYLVAALQRIDPSVGQAASAMLQASPPPPAEALLTALINDVDATSHPLVLVLDDYHVIHTLAIHQQLTFLVEHQPRRMHLVLATREEPPLPLPRLRVCGQAVEIRQADLRFTAEETADFLQRTAGLELPQDEVAALHRRTEGWVAGLQLAALSLHGSEDTRQFVQSFAGSHTYVLDYLLEEVFRRQPADLRDFLLKTSVLERFNASICDAITERDDSQSLLSALHHANAFVVPLDAQRQWYRYHHLFADLLRHRFEAKSEYDAAELHRRASRWYEEHGFLVEAVDHSLSGAEWPRATDLILRSAESLTQRGELVTLLGWYRSLPQEIILEQPRLCLEYAWPLLLTEQIDAAEPYLAHAEHMARDRDDQAFLGELAAARAHIARMQGNHHDIRVFSERALALLPPDAYSIRSVVATNVGVARWYRGNLPGAESSLREVANIGTRAGNDYARLTALIFLARIQVARGDRHQAAIAYRHIIAAGEAVPTVSLAHCDLARLLCEWNDLAQAMRHVQRGIEHVGRSGSPELLASGFGTLALVAQASGHEEAASEALAAARGFVDTPGVSAAAHVYHQALRISVATAQRDLVAAGHAAAALPSPEAAASLPDYLFAMLAKGRYLLATGDRTAAGEHLAALHTMASQAGWIDIALQTRALQALAAPTA